MSGLSRRRLQGALLGLSLTGLAESARAHAPRRMKLAVAQMQCEDGDILGNLTRATPLAEAARAQGARLILFPELMPTGYALNKSLWSAAEPRHGPTARWLSATSRRLGCWIGTSFLESQGPGYFNTFLLTDPVGREAGRVRKETPASMEASLFQGEAGPHRIDSSLGRIGIGICYESYLCSLERRLAAARPDLILLPHSFPGTQESGGLASPPGTHVALWHAQRFGVPVAMSNKVGAWSTTTLTGARASGRFPGASAIVDSDGEIRALMNDEAGVAVADVVLDPTRKPAFRPGCEGELISDLTKFDWLGSGG